MVREKLKVAVVVVMCFIGTLFANGEQKNMVEEGGVEVVKEHMATSFTTALKGGWDFGDDIMITLPVFYDQLSGNPGKILVVEGEEGCTVYKGKKGLYMEGNFSGFYIRVSPRHSRKGEKYRMKFWAKGEGKISVNLVGFDGVTGKACEIIPKSVNISDRWTEYVMDFEVTKEEVTDIGPAIYVTGKAWVDEIFFGKPE
jgi:hypothetical protein